MMLKRVKQHVASLACLPSHRRYISLPEFSNAKLLRPPSSKTVSSQRPHPLNILSATNRHRHLIATSAGQFSMTASTAESMAHHQKAVDDISRSVKGYYERKEKFRIFHGSTNSTRPFAAKGSRFVDTSKLSHVLKVDAQKRTVLVEPNVPMDRLVEETLKYGLVPPVVMEFPGITVGGGYAGTSGESSSFKHGFFDRTINYVEMVLANGEVVTCSSNEKPDLFHGAAGAVGSLGITTLIELQLRDAKKYVETIYHPVSSISEAIKKIEEATSDSELDYVDGILFSKSQGAVITGRMTNNPTRGIAIQHFSDAKDPWFYLHVKDTITKRTGPTTEAIPLAEYLFRYDRGGFWVGASAFEYFGMPFNSYTRWWLDDFLHTRMMYTALHASGQSRTYVVQDLAVPYSTVGQFIEYTDEVFGIWPLWLCPLRPSPQPSMHPHSATNHLEPLLNIGLWGYGPSKYDDFVAVNRELERKVRELGGMKWLYAHTYYAEDEFWEMFNREWYDSLREKYDATSLPDVYEKVKIDVTAEKKAAESAGLHSLLTTWPMSGFYGIKKAIESGAYLQARKASWRASTADRFRMTRK